MVTTASFGWRTSSGPVRSVGLGGGSVLPLPPDASGRTTGVHVPACFPSVWPDWSSGTSSQCCCHDSVEGLDDGIEGIRTRVDVRDCALPVVEFRVLGNGGSRGRTTSTGHSCVNIVAYVVVRDTSWLSLGTGGSSIRMEWERPTTPLPPWLVGGRDGVSRVGGVALCRSGWVVPPRRTTPVLSLQPAGASGPPVRAAFSVRSTARLCL
jgi:hypothetical protein